MFYGTKIKDYTEEKAMLQDIYGRDKTKPRPAPANIFNIKSLDPMNQTIGGIVAGTIADPASSIFSHQRIKVGRKIKDDAQNEIINKLDTMFILGGAEVDQSLENLKIMMKGNEDYIFGKEFGSFAFESMHLRT